MKEPIAYAAAAADGSESVYVASLKEQAEACCRMMRERGTPIGGV